MITLLLAVGVAMVVSFLCSVMEAAILSLNPGKLAVLLQQHPRAGQLCREFKANIEQPIAVILILNTTAHTFGAAIAGAQFDQLFGDKYIWLFSLIFTLMMVQYTEILPKTLGVRFNLPVMRWTAGTLHGAVKVLHPLIKLVHLVNRPFEQPTPPEAVHEPEALQELDALSHIAVEQQHISPLQGQAIRQIPDLKADPVSEIMTPEAQMVVISEGMSRSEVLKIMKKHRHSRYPVLSSNGGFSGVLELRQMLFSPDDNWEKLLRPVIAVEENCSQLYIAENLTLFDSKLILVRNSRKKRIVGMFTTNDLLMNLFVNREGVVSRN